MIRMNKIFVGIISFIFVVLLSACQTDLVYTESKNIDSEGWLDVDTLVFTPQVEDIEKTYNIYAWVRHTKDYKNSNVWLKFISEPQLSSDSTGLVDIKIADKMGAWLGDCSQSLCTQRVLLKENYQFKNTSAFKVEVLQYMREENLKEIKNVGLEIELINEN